MSFNKKIYYCLRIWAIAMLMSLPLMTLAQGPEDPGGDPDAVPIDGGLSVLVAAGVAYGAKKLRDAKKKTNGDKNVS